MISKAATKHWFHWNQLFKLITIRELHTKAVFSVSAKAVSMRWAATAHYSLTWWAPRVMATPKSWAPTISTSRAYWVLFSPNPPAVRNSHYMACINVRSNHRGSARWLGKSTILTKNDLDTSNRPQIEWIALTINKHVYWRKYVVVSTINGMPHLGVVCVWWWWGPEPGSSTLYLSTSVLKYNF